MDALVTERLKKTATVVMVPFILLGIFIFSVFGAIGLMLSLASIPPFIQIFGNSDVDTLPAIFVGFIALFILGPTVVLVWRAKGHRWAALLNTMLLLWVYLVIGGMIIYLSIYFAEAAGMLDSTFNDRGGVLRTYCQVISVSLAFAYCIYFIKFIKPQVLK